MNYNIVIALVCSMFILFAIVLLNQTSKEKGDTASKNKDENITVNEYFEDGMVHSSIYFIAIDKNGNKSFAHSISVTPEMIEDVETPIQFTILKEEWNDGIHRSLNTPVSIKYGQHPKKMNKMLTITPNHLTIANDSYIVNIGPSSIVYATPNIELK